MARIIGVELPDKKRVLISLTYLYGIGISRSKEILKKVNVDENKKTSGLSEEELRKINNLLTEEYVLEGDLRNGVSNSIKRLIQINCYRGQRHKRKLPVRGQRTKTNAKTRKGRGRAVANKKIVKG